MEEFSLQDIFRILLRWKKYFLITFFLLFTITIFSAMRWSNYRSTATVQIELSTISQNIINNPNENIVTLADQRINQIQQKITSSESLAQIITKFNLYPENTKNVPIAILTDMMRSKINLSLISGIIASPAAAQKQTAEQLSAIGFTLSFDYKDPQLAQQITDELITRFLDEDLKMRQTQTKETSEFIATQIAIMEKNIAEQEKSIADFRSENGESGPAALMFNQQAINNITMNIQSIEAQITSNEGTQGTLRSQLTTVSPYSLITQDGQIFITPEVQLKILKTQYATLIGKYGNKHPDIVKLRRQISALKTQTDTSLSIGSGELQRQISDVNTKLTKTSDILGSEHPDILTLQNRLNKLEDVSAKTPKQNNLDDFIKNDADNPAYIQLVTQLTSTKEQHKSLLNQRDELIEQRTKYEKAMASNPSIEQKLSQLSRDYENSQLRFRELKEKKMTAELNEQLELSRKGQRLIVTNPPKISNETNPRRSFIILGGLVISILGGFVSVVIADFSTQTVYGAKHLTSLVGVMPLAVVPHIFSEPQKESPLISKFRSLYEKTIMHFKLYKNS